MLPSWDIPFGAANVTFQNWFEKLQMPRPICSPLTNQNPDEAIFIDAPAVCVVAKYHSLKHYKLVF